MFHNFTAKHEDVVLQPMTIEDSEKYRRLRNQNEIRCWFETQIIISEEAQRNWFLSYLKKSSDLMFSIYHTDGVFIGGCSLYKIESGGTAEFGRLIIAPEFRGNGFGRKATTATLEIAKKIGLQSVHLEVFADNQTAIRTYCAAGFMANGKTIWVNDKQMIKMVVQI